MVIPLGLFLWTAVIRPLLAWLRGEPVQKAVKDEGKKGEGEGKSSEMSDVSANGKSDGNQSLR